MMSMLFGSRPYASPSQDLATDQFAGWLTASLLASPLLTLGLPVYITRRSRAEARAEEARLRQAKRGQRGAARSPAGPLDPYGATAPLPAAAETPARPRVRTTGTGTAGRAADRSPGPGPRTGFGTASRR